MDRHAPVYYRTQDGEVTQPDSTVGDDDAMRIDTHSAVFVTYKESYVGTSVINTPVRAQEEPWLFTDHRLGITAKPIYSYTQGELEFVFRFNTRYAAEQWVNDIKVRIGDNREYFTHELRFHYPVPKELLMMLKHFHTLREEQSGYGESYDEWMKRCITPAYSSVTNQAGSGRTPVIRQTQIGITGWFDFEEPEAPEKGDETGTWSSSITYRFEYQKPVEINFVYPLLIHNQLIDECLFSTDPLYRIDDRIYDSNITRLSDEVSHLNEKRQRRNTGGVILPPWDEWLPKHMTPSTATMLIACLMLDPDNPRSLFDLREDIAPFEWHPSVIKFFIESEAPYIGKLGKSILYMQLYENDRPLADGILEMDSEGYIYATEPLSLRNTYHIRMAFILRFSMLDKDAIDRLTKWPDALWEIFDSIVPGGLHPDGWEHFHKNWGNGFNGWAYDGGSLEWGGGVTNGGLGHIPGWNPYLPGGGSNVPGWNGGSGTNNWGNGGGGGSWTGGNGSSVIPPGWGPNHPDWKDDYFPPDYIEDIFKKIEDFLNGANAPPIRDTAGRTIDQVRIMNLSLIYMRREDLES
jgi:hypothetical protein